MSEGFRITRLSDPREVLAVSEPLEPKTVLVSSAAIGAAFPNRAWMVRDGDGNDAACVVCERVCRGRWVAFPLLLDVRAAPVAASIVESAGARSMEGPTEYVEPLLPHLRRPPHTVVRIPASAGEKTLPAGVFPIDPRVRLAQPSDLEGLVDLYKEYELNSIPTVPRLREFLRRSLRRGPIGILEEDGKIVAAMRADARSNRYLYWSAQTVRPEYRGQRLGAALYGFLTAIQTDSGLGWTVTTAPTNNTRPRPDLLANPVIQRHTLDTVRDTWTTVSLRSRRWLPGRYRPRRLWYALAGRTAPRPKRIRRPA
jgi:GNAT superfamily N-acetyltransferase